MKQIKNNKKQSGQGLVEYLIIVALVAVGGIGIMQIVGKSINVKFAEIASSLGASGSEKIEKAEITQSSVTKKNFRNFMKGFSTDGKNQDGSNQDNNGQ